MGVFRRRSPGGPGVTDAARPAAPGQDEADPAAPPRPGMTAAKGRPTPKRSEAESRRRQPHSAPTDRKTARQRDATERQRKMAAMRRGEDWALPRKDKGPVRALARDYVDSRRTLSEYYLYAVVLLIVALFVPALHRSLLIDYLVLAILAVLLLESYLIGRRVISLAQQRYPGESIRGVRIYAAMRGTQMRRLRMPAPRVSRGDKI
jgi:Protein of unknown function (DUF3043)